MARYINPEGARIYVSDFVCEQMKKIPTADVVSVDACKQILKERDFAIKQLHSYGVQFGEKADVVEVKHGEWIDDGFGRGNMICSLCKQYPVDDEDGNPLSVLIGWQPEFCPHCGAKMDGGKVRYYEYNK